MSSSGGGGGGGGNGGNPAAAAIASVSAASGAKRPRSKPPIALPVERPSREALLAAPATLFGTLFAPTKQASMTSFFSKAASVTSGGVVDLTGGDGSDAPPPPCAAPGRGAAARLP